MKTKIAHIPNEALFPKLKERAKLTHLGRLIKNAVLLSSQWQLQGQEPDDNRIFASPLKDLLEICGLLEEGGSYQFHHVKKHFIALRHIDISWRFNDAINRPTDVTTGLIEKPGFTYDKNGIIVQWQMDKRVQQVVGSPDGNFTKIDLELTSKLSSGSAVALYEVCRRYLGNKFGEGDAFTKTEPLAWWFLVLKGDPQANPEYKIFNRDTLQPAIQEINNLRGGDIEIELETIKAGRAVTALRFLVRPRLDSINQAAPIQKTIETRLQLLGLNKKQCMALIEKYQTKQDYLEKHLAGAEFARARKTIKETTAGWFYSALKNDFNYDQVQSTTVTHASHKFFESAVMQPSNVPAQQALDIDGAIEKFHHLDGAEKEEIKIEFLKAHTHWKRIFDDDLSNIMVKKDLGAWLIAEGKVR